MCNRFDIGQPKASAISAGAPHPCAIILGVKLFTSALLLLAWLLLASLATATTPVEEASEADEAAAREAYIEAKKHYDALELEEALSGFQRSYAAVASPNSQLMIARVLDRLGRHVHAFETMRATMREAERVSALSPELAKKYKKTLDTATALTAELRHKVGFVSIVLVGATDREAVRVTLNGNPVDAVDEPVIVFPGRVVVAVQNTSGRREVSAEVAGGGQQRVEIEVPGPAPLPLPAPVQRDDDGVRATTVLAFGSAGIGVAGFTLFAVFGALTLDAFDTLEQSCPLSRCPATSQPDIEDGQTYQSVANVGLVVGVAGAIASVALFLFDASRAKTAIVIPTSDGVAIGARF